MLIVQNFPLYSIRKYHIPTLYSLDYNQPPQPINVKYVCEYQSNLLDTSHQNSELVVLSELES